MWQEDTSGANTTVVASTPVVVVSTPTATPEARPTSTATTEARPTPTATTEARPTPTATTVYDTWAHWGSDAPNQQEDSSLSSLDQSEDSDTTAGDRWSGASFVEPHFQCGPTLHYQWDYFEDTIFWANDTSEVVFSDHGDIWAVKEDGTELRQIVESHAQQLQPNTTRFKYGFHMDLSPDNSTIIYTSCQYPTERKYPGYVGVIQDGVDFSERSKYTYEIAVSGLDGNIQKRITHNSDVDHYPVWSPDGSRVAFIRFEGRSVKGQLHVMSSDGSTQKVTPDHISVAFVPPVWSPDCKRLAFVVNEGEQGVRGQRGAYTVKADGSELFRIGNMIEGLPGSTRRDAAPSWSPNSERVAFAQVDDEEAVINTVQFDGSDLRRIWSIGPTDYGVPAVSQVIWTPNGSELLFRYGKQVLAVRMDDGGIQYLRDTDGVRRLMVDGGQVALSPDGSRLAMYQKKDSRVMTIDMDGTNLRILAVQDSYEEPFRLAGGQAP